MDASCSKEVSSSREFNKSLTESDDQFIQKHQNQAVILIIQMNFMKIIFLKIYQLHLTLRIKTMMINGFR